MAIAPAAPRPAQIVAARVLVVVGLAVNNWWVTAPFHSGLIRSSSALFSDLEATGQPDAVLFRNLDFAAGALLVAGLLLRGSSGRWVARRPEWPWLIVFAVAGAVGARASYQCPEATSGRCRSLEWHLKLPPHHYVHILAGVVEFFSITYALWLAWRRTRRDRTPEAVAYRVIAAVLIVSYPLLGAAYLSDHFGVFIEPVFFLAFSAILATEVFEPPLLDVHRRARREVGTDPLF
jgi:hypothetical protein